MPKRREPVLKSQVAQDILHVLKSFALDRQFLPVQRGLYNYMGKLGYPYSLGTFNYWFARLVEAGLIEVEWCDTRAIRATDLRIVETGADPDADPPRTPLGDS